MVRNTLFILYCFSVISFAMPKIAVADSIKGYQMGDKLPDNKATRQNSSYRGLNWEELMPANWDPMKAIKGLDLSKLQDSDPKAIQALEIAKKEWDNAPVIDTLDGVRVHVAGFVVPLDNDYNRLKQFLLVPYFGACIHVPPPPSNQVIHVILPPNASNDQLAILKNAVTSQQPLEVKGLMQTKPTFTKMAVSSYTIYAEMIERYNPPPDK